MADYLAQRVIDRALDYSDVTTKFPTLKSNIDAYLAAHEASDKIK